MIGRMSFVNEEGNRHQSGCCCCCCLCPMSEKVRNHKIIMLGLIFVCAHMRGFSEMVKFYIKTQQNGNENDNKLHYLDYLI
jgi:hypothetical protein